MSIRLKVALLVVLLAILSGVGSAAYVYGYIHSEREVAETFVEIAPGEGYSSVLSEIEAKGLASWRFGNLAALKLAGGPKVIKAGVYRFVGRVSVWKVLDDIAHGRVDLVSVTMPEGLTAREMAGLLEAAGVTEAVKFRAIAYSPEAPRKYGFTAPTLEGYLFPDTYRFARKVPAQAVVDVMVGRFREVAAQVSPSQKAGPLDLAGWVTLASIVEKETGAARERPLIASVFFNRLRIGMKLQTDPTVIYGMKDFDGNIRRADLLRDTPYNTYTRAGLPPGAIANPGRASLEAVAKPAESGYLYFVSKNDGTHQFSVTLAEHNLAVRKYQLGGR